MKTFWSWGEWRWSTRSVLMCRKCVSIPSVRKVCCLLLLPAALLQKMEKKNNTCWAVCDDCTLTLWQLQSWLLHPNTWKVQLSQLGRNMRGGLQIFCSCLRSSGHLGPPPCARLSFLLPNLATCDAVLPPQSGCSPLLSSRLSCPPLERDWKVCGAGGTSWTLQVTPRLTFPPLTLWASRLGSSLSLCHLVLSVAVTSCGWFGYLVIVRLLIFG